MPVRKTWWRETFIRLPRRSSILTRAWARAVYAGKRVVGFRMYDAQKTKGQAQAREASIYRFMIERKQQGKGFGRASLSKALGEIRAIPRVNRISIRYMPDNPVAQPFYATFSIVKVGRICDGEIISVLKL